MIRNNQSLASSADIAAAMLRFCEEAAYPSPLGPPEGWPRTAEACYIFRYSEERILRDRIADYLDGLSCPVLLTPTLTTGTVVLTLLDDLSGLALSAAQRRFRAQEEAARAFPFIKPGDNILLEFDDERIVFTMDTFHDWCKNYIVDLSWGLSRLEGDEAANVSLNLTRADGHRSTHRRWEG